MINQRRILQKQNKRQEMVPKLCHLLHVFPYKQACGFKLIMAPSSQIIDLLGVLALSEKWTGLFRNVGSLAGPLVRLKNQNTDWKRSLWLGSAGVIDTWCHFRNKQAKVVSSLDRVKLPFAAHHHPPSQILKSPKRTPGSEPGLASFYPFFPQPESRGMWF